MSAYAVITRETTTIIPSARALPTFSWPRTTSLWSWLEIWSVTIGLPWLIRAAAVA
jgi:hypothetical protein